MKIWITKEFDTEYDYNTVRAFTNKEKALEDLAKAYTSLLEEIDNDDIQDCEFNIENYRIDTIYGKIIADIEEIEIE